MAELRQDPVSGYSVLIAENRAARPQEVVPTKRRVVVPCPFCPGHESETPVASAAYPAGADSWEVRVVPNKYPAVQVSANAEGSSAAYGAHEVIIESRSHAVSFSAVTDLQAELTFAAYRDRLQALKRDERLAYGLVFKNARADGGASLEHTHSQLLATSVVPSAIQLEVTRASEHWMLHGRCIFCDLLVTETNAGRVVAKTEHFAAFCPFASRFPYEMWVLPIQHQTCFEETPPARLAELGCFVRELLCRLESCLNEPAYNYWLHDAPFRLSPHDDYHWHIEIAPRLARLAGYELGTGCFINSVAPERAADRLRSAVPSASP